MTARGRWSGNVVRWGRWDLGPVAHLPPGPGEGQVQQPEGEEEAEEEEQRHREPVEEVAEGVPIEYAEHPVDGDEGHDEQGDPDVAVVEEGQVPGGPGASQRLDEGLIWRCNSR